MAKKPQKTKSPPFVMLPRAVLDSAAWKSLNPTARALFIELRGLVDNRNPAINNGRLFLGVRDAAARLNVGPRTAKHAFYDLRRVGLIVVTEQGHVGLEGQGRATCYRLADCAAHGHPLTGSREFERWSPGNDFPIEKGPPPIRRAAEVVEPAPPAADPPDPLAAEIIPLDRRRRRSARSRSEI